MSRFRLLILILVFAAAYAACGGDGPSGSGEDAAPPDPLTGVITDIDSAGIGAIRSFTLTTMGRSYEFHIADDVDYGFDLGHLQEHRTSAEPVTVEHEERDDGRRYALSIEDA